MEDDKSASWQDGGLDGRVMGDETGDVASVSASTRSVMIMVVVVDVGVTNANVDVTG